jgi:hypothetical protein
MPSVTSAAGPIHLGMDVSKNTIVVGILVPGSEVPQTIQTTETPARHQQELDEPLHMSALAPGPRVGAHGRKRLLASEGPGVVRASVGVP